MAHPELNGGWRFYRAVIGMMFAAILGLSGYTWSVLATQVSHLSSAHQLGAERLVKAETEIGMLKTQLERMEAKLDKALERKP